MNKPIHEIDFKSKECKNQKHVGCNRAWKGLGFIVTCACHCHSNVDKKIIVNR